MTALATSLGRRYSPERVGNLDGYEVYHVDQGRTVERLRKALKVLPEVAREGRGLLFYGPVGTGKDHLLACALYQLAGQGVECNWINGQEMYGTFRDNMDSGREGQNEQALIAKWLKPAVLAISDPTPAVGDLSSWNFAQLGRLIDRRYRELKPTWMALNALNLADAEARLSSPILDRLQETCELFPCFWPSYRERKRKAAG